jgi:hypothetical protein
MSIIHTVTLLSVIIGIFLIFVGLSIGIFDQWTPNNITFVFGCIFASVGVCWLGYMIYPGKKRFQQRRNIKKRRRERALAQKPLWYTLDDVPTELDEDAYKSGIVPFPEMEQRGVKHFQDKHHNMPKIEVSAKYLALGKCYNEDSTELVMQSMA